MHETLFGILSLLGALSLAFVAGATYRHRRDRIADDAQNAAIACLHDRLAKVETCVLTSVD